MMREDDQGKLKSVDGDALVLVREAMAGSTALVVDLKDLYPGHCTHSSITG